MVSRFVNEHVKIEQFSGTIVLNEMKKTTNLETNLHALDKFTNYSVRVLAYTRIGEGIQSSPVYCLTEQDGIVTTHTFVFSLAYTFRLPF